MVWYRVKQQVKSEPEEDKDLLLSSDQVRKLLPWMESLLLIDPYCTVTAVFDGGDTTVLVHGFET